VENAEVENVANRRILQGWKMEEWKIAEKTAVSIERQWFFGQTMLTVSTSHHLLPCSCAATVMLAHRVSHSH